MKHTECKNRFPVFKERLEKLRGDMSNTEFATFLGMSRQTVGFYLSGERIPDILGLRQIAEKCNVSADYLIGRTDTPTPDIEVRAICEYTGLSNEAIEKLSYLSRIEEGQIIQSLNSLITARNFLDVLLRLCSVKDKCVQISAFQDNYLNNIRDMSRCLERDLDSRAAATTATAEASAKAQALHTQLRYVIFELSESIKDIADEIHDYNNYLRQISFTDKELYSLVLDELFPNTKK